MCKKNNNIEIFENENNYLMKSSLLFLIPGIYGISKKKYLLSSVLIIGPIISYRFWSKPKYDIWRTADIICANIGMCLFIGNAALNIKKPTIKYIIYYNYLCGTGFFLNAINEYKKKNKYWYIDHLSMHIAMLIGHSINICSS